MPARLDIPFGVEMTGNVESIRGGWVMLEVQMRVLSAWMAAGDAMRARVARGPHDERGEVTATTAIIVLLVGRGDRRRAVIASKITINANNVPSP